MRSRKRILYIQFTNPGGYPPLEHSSRILAQRGWEVLFLGTQMPGTRDLSLAPAAGVRVRLLPYRPGSWYAKLGLLQFIAWTLCWVLWWRPRWLYVSDPLAAPAGWLLRWLPGLKIIYHEHDSPDPDAVRGRFMKLILWFRRRLARVADLCVLPNDERLRALQRQAGRTARSHVVWNCPELAEAETSASPAEEKFWLVYFGSINPERIPLAVVEALTLLPATVGLRVIGYETIGHRGYMRELQESATRSGVGARIDYRGSMSRTEGLRTLRTAQLGLAFMPMASTDINMRHMIGASNKPFDYLAGGIPLLVSRLPDWERAFVEPGYARSCDPDDPSSIADAVRWFLEHPQARREMGEHGRKAILDEWNYERQFEPVRQIIEEQSR